MAEQSSKDTHLNITKTMEVPLREDVQIRLCDKSAKIPKSTEAPSPNAKNFLTRGHLPRNEEPDWNYWNKYSTWTLEEAVCLLCCYEPNALPKKDKSPFNSEFYRCDIAKNLRKLYKLAVNEIRAGNLKASNIDPIEVFANDFIVWIKDNGFSTPPPLKPEDGTNFKSSKGEPSTKANAPLEEDVASRIVRLTVRYENESEITIQDYGGLKQTIPADNLNFRNQKTKAWQNFLKVLKSPPNYYWECPEDADRQALKTIDKKLQKWMSNNLGITFPDQYRLFEWVKSQKPGTYQFKFKIQYGDTEHRDQSSDHALKKKLTAAVQGVQNDKFSQYSRKKLEGIISECVQRGIIDNDVAEEYWENASNYKEDRESSGFNEKEDDHTLLYGESEDSSETDFDWGD